MAIRAPAEATMSGEPDTSSGSSFSSSLPTDSASQLKLAVALRDPSIYGDSAGEVEVIETHISYVYLAGPYAYKIKKAVDLGFLDFRTLQARRFYCDEELRLNRRLAPALYLEVIAITGSHDRPILGGEGTPIEYAVKMHRFRQDQLLDRLLQDGGLTVSYVDQLAVQMSKFHGSAPAAALDSLFGTACSIEQLALDNFTQIRAAVGSSISTSDLDAVETWTRSQCAALAEIFGQRKAGGFVRECHGDFHLGNIALVKNAVTVFDCIEFNARLRWIDVMSEVAFLVMDLRAGNRRELAQRFLNRYLEITGDYGGLSVLRFYVVYRAMVRAKVHCLRASQSGIGAEATINVLAGYDKYIRLAKDQIGSARAAVMITHGLSGSGKTTLSQSLLEPLGAIRIRSDVERKRLHGLHAMDSSGAEIGRGLYTFDATVLTYQRLADLAKMTVRAGYPAIVDATFLKRSQRDAFSQLAQELQVPFFILHVAASEGVMRARIVEREQQRNDASEAGIEVFEHQLATQEPLQPDELAVTSTMESTAQPDLNSARIGRIALAISFGESRN